MTTIKLFNENCFDRFSKIQNESIDLVCSDPPYAINFQDTHSKTEDWDALSDDEYRNLLRNFLTESYRVLKPNGQGWMFFGPTKIDAVMDVFREFEKEKKLQRNLENYCVYARNKGRGSTKKLKSLREDILHFSKGPYKTWNYVEYYRQVVCPYVKDGKPRGWALDIASGQNVRFTGAGNVLYFSAPSYINKWDPLIHSAQKPILLNCMLIMLASNQGDTVLDPFMGSGSSGIATHLCNRNYIGIEREKEVFEKAEKWVKNFNYDNVEEYIKTHISSTEKHFKFGQDNRYILPKLT
jgi:site-specific DNA-methyltransferase (adenine-specific)